MHYAVTRLTVMCGPMSDLVFASLEKAWSYMTPNVLTETGCHETTQIKPNQTFTQRFVFVFHTTSHPTLWGLLARDLHFRHNPIWMCMCDLNGIAVCHYSLCVLFQLCGVAGSQQHFASPQHCEVSISAQEFCAIICDKICENIYDNFAPDRPL